MAAAGENGVSFTYPSRKKSEGKRLGRPKGRLSTVTKLTGKDELIREYLEKKIPQTVIARLLNVNRLVVFQIRL